MQVYRIDKKDYKDQFPPKGSLFSAGRWNTKGIWVIYTSDSIALAKLEILANSGVIPENRVLRIIEVKNNAPLVEIKTSDLPNNWKDFPYPPVLATQIKAIIETKQFIGAIVPSVQSPLEKNILLFPDHPDFRKYVKEKEQVEEYFDSRLKGKSS
ncbi:MAG: RES family NAD+ phosphorylase [Candidatus Cyclobacteriaceae bacterium M2_1C_046]